MNIQIKPAGIPEYSTPNIDRAESFSSTYSWSSSSASTNSDQNTTFSLELLEVAYSDIEDTIDRLNRLSSSIRRSGAPITSGRVENLVPEDEDGQDMTPEQCRQ